jgi:hypothetical protein
LTAVQLATPTNTATPVNAAVQRTLVGPWRGVVRSQAVRSDSGTSIGLALNCSQSWEIASQSGGHLEGRMSSQGNSPESDWRCTQTRSFDGDVTADQRVTIRFSPAFKAGGCTNIAGGDIATGSIFGETIVVDLPFRATCEMSPSGGPSVDLDVTATITLSPR